MEKRILHQEDLKALACVTMLLDHIGAVFFPGNIWLRIIGRLSFPIYCFLIAEGAHHTKNPTGYALRLFVGMLLAELPFDLCFRGRIYLGSQSVMMTLMLGYLMIMCMEKTPEWCKPLIALPFALAAKYLRTDYGAMGVLLIAAFYLPRNSEWAMLLQAAGLGLLCLWKFASGNVLQIFAIAAIFPSPCIPVKNAAEILRCNGASTCSIRCI